MSEYDIHFALIMSVELLHCSFAHPVERFVLLIAFFYIIVIFLKR